jgi:uncharacterized damage-inducible protein DinB
VPPAAVRCGAPGARRAGARPLPNRYIPPVADRPPPFTLADERRTLVDFLDYLREAVVAKVGGLDEAAARWSPVGSGTSLLGLVRHLTMVEVTWFQRRFAGDEVAVPDGDLHPGATVDSVVADYRAACARSAAIVAGCDDLDRRCARFPEGREPVSLRWILVHMVEETARHAGHADLLREQLDGSTGR